METLASVWSLALLLAPPDASAAPASTFDFESGTLSPLVQGSGGGEVRIVAEGEDFSSESDTTTLAFPSPTRALLLRAGWSGGQLDIAGAEAEILVTREQLSLSLCSEPALGLLPRPLLSVSSGGESTLYLPQPSPGSFSERLVPLEGLCGQTAEITLSSTAPEGSTAALFTLVDDLTLSGTPCPGYVDADGDGWCILGEDLDGDGACDGLGEEGLGEDCDDLDPLRSPGLLEIAGDGLDNDCDGGDLPGTRSIGGTLLEDVDGDGDLSDGVPMAGASVEIFVDGGDGAPDGLDDRPLATVSADDNGYFELLVGETLDLWLAVDSRTLPAAPSAWAEQTFGPKGALCADGLGASEEAAAQRPCFGGRRAAVSDGPGLEAREHIVRIARGPAQVEEITFGFSFHVWTTTRDGDDDPSSPRSVQGSLRQFLGNAAALPGPHRSRFIPVEPRGEGGFVVVPASLLPEIPAETILDGTALCDGLRCPLGSRWSAGEDLLPGVIVGVGRDGVPGSGDEDTIPDLERPGVEVWGEIALGGRGAELISVALPADPVSVLSSETAVRRSLLGYSASGVPSGLLGQTAIPIAPRADQVTLEELWISADADGISREGPGDRLHARAIRIAAPPEGHSGPYAAVRLSAAGAWSRGGELSRLHLSQMGGPAVAIGGGEGGLGLQIVRSTITGALGPGIELGEGDHEIRIARSLVVGSAGPGILVSPDASGVRVARSAVIESGGPAIDLGGDGVSANDGLALPGANGGIDAPVLSEVLLASGALWISGSAPPGSEIDLYEAADDGDQSGEIVEGDGLWVPHGELARFLGRCEADLYGQISCDLSPDVGPLLLPGDLATAIATVGGSSSEASANIAVISEETGSDTAISETGLGDSETGDTALSETGTSDTGLHETGQGTQETGISTSESADTAGGPAREHRDATDAAAASPAGGPPVILSGGGGARCALAPIPGGGTAGLGLFICTAIALRRRAPSRRSGRFGG